MIMIIMINMINGNESTITIIPNKYLYQSASFGTIHFFPLLTLRLLAKAVSFYEKAESELCVSTVLGK